MRARDWFGVGVRLLGVWCLLTAAAYVIGYADVRLGFATPMNNLGLPEGGRSSYSYLFYALGYVLVGIVFLVFAEPIVRLAYRDESEALRLQQHDDDAE